MNGTEQRTHATRTEQLEARVRQLETLLTASLHAISEERDRRLALGVDQRTYVDKHDGELSACCQERWDETSARTKRLFDLHYTFCGMTFWQRLRWLVLGS